MTTAGAVLVVGTIGACASSSGGAAATSAAAQTPASSGPTGSPGSSCDPTGLPPELACVTFTSVSGTSTSADVAWLSDGTFTVTLEGRDGAAVLGVGTPCNALTVPVTIDGPQLVPDKDHIATTLMACGDDATAQEHWATQFVSKPMTYSVAGTQLTLATAGEQVVLEHH